MKTQESNTKHNRKMNKIVILILMFVVPSVLLAQDEHDHSHGGHDHSGHGETISEDDANASKISESTSTKYEAVIKYADIHSGEDAQLELFICDVETNRALDSLDIKLNCPDMNNNSIALNRKDKGWYTFNAHFPKDGHYNFQVDINGPLGNATLILKDIEIGGHSHEEKENNQSESSWYSNPILTFIAGVLVVLIVVFLIRITRNKKVAALFIPLMLLVSQQTFSPTLLSAQDEHGHDHGGESKQKDALTDEFNVPKETQFLFDIRTASIRFDSYSPARKVLGRVIASPDGYSEVHAPQSARMANINARIGQYVTKGEVLATVELIPDAASQVTLLASLNEAKAEFEAAKNEVDRLKIISDIASKKQQDEAKARLEIARENIKLLETGGAKSFMLRSPIAGYVEPYFYSAGSSIKPEDVIFRISNSEHILIEAQVYEEDLLTIKQSPRFVAQCADQSHTLLDLKLEGIGQRLNTVNQSQQVLFGLSNQEGALRIGESVSVFVYENTNSANHFVPNSALNEINGKPVVFVKESAEKFRVVYVSAGRDNGIYTEILAGLKDGEKVITEGTYQIKMIFLNQ